ncbi:MAG: hypothetical protein PHT15_08585 [Gallionellaceae bacterium]|nr:hypothetical protein [Gallionellaceae bacterium]
MRRRTLVLLLAISLAPAAHAGGLGRLFFTPQQRAQLEHDRAHKPAAGEDSPATVLTVNGIVQRKGGARTVWINGKAQNAGNSDEHAPESMSVAVPGKAQPVRVKVGQRLLLEQPAPPKPAARKTVDTGNEDD